VSLDKLSVNETTNMVKVNLTPENNMMPTKDDLIKKA